MAPSRDPKPLPPPPDSEPEAPEQVAKLQNRLRLAHQARRAKERQLDDIRRALCDIGFMEDDDPYSHADLADVIRQNGQEEASSHTMDPGREQPTPHLNVHLCVGPLDASEIGAHVARTLRKARRNPPTGGA
jgi:hypothetical protein